MENKYQFSVKYQKEQHSINAETYVQSLISLTTILREINYQIGDNEGVGVNVLAQEPGSFDVTLEIIKLVNQNTSLIKVGVEVLAGLVTITLGVIELKKYFAKADNTKTVIEGDQVNIKDSNGDIIFQTNKSTYNIFMYNQAVNDAVSDQFESVSKDLEMEAISISTDHKTITVEREDFALLSQKRVVEVGETDTVEVAAQVTISKLVLDNPDRKWEFVYNGSKVSGKIVDKNFWEKIINGDVSFSNGDVLVGDLIIEREYDTSLGVYLNKDYSLSNIRQHLPRTRRQQTTLEDLTP